MICHGTTLPRREKQKQKEKESPEARINSRVHLEKNAKRLTMYFSFNNHVSKFHLLLS